MWSMILLSRTRDSGFGVARFQRWGNSSHEAKLASQSSVLGTQPSVVVWGTPRREFLYSDDLADACLFLMETHDVATIGDLVNIGVGPDITITELAKLVVEAVGFCGDIAFDASIPDGAPQKLLDTARLAALGWRQCPISKPRCRRSTKTIWSWPDKVPSGARDRSLRRGSTER